MGMMGRTPMTAPAWAPQVESVRAGQHGRFGQDLYEGICAAKGGGIAHGERNGMKVTMVTLKDMMYRWWGYR
jgi:hypothetical protein